MISALGWMRREAAAVHPAKYRLTDEDYDAFMRQASEQIRQTRVEAEAAGIDLDAELQTRPEPDQDAEDNEELSKYNLDAYDSDPAGEEAETDGEDVDLDGDMELDPDDSTLNGIFTPLNRLVKPPSGTDGDATESDEEMDEEEREDLTLRPTDLLFVAANTEDEVSQLEVYVYEEAVADGKGHTEENLYVHHDVMLPSFPLCLEWIDYPFGEEPSSRPHGNFVAVGSFEPHIEIWNLDVLDLIYPTVTLGRNPGAGLVHRDAVMALSWNANSRNFLLSGSADHSVLLWDVTRGDEALRAFSHHTDKVQSLQWHPQRPSVILSGSYDRSAFVFDARSPAEGARFGPLVADVETVRWNPLQEHQFAVADESGRVSFFDMRQPGAPVSVLDAHGKATTCLAFCPLANDHGQSLFLTASTDKSLKIWSLDPATMTPHCLQTREMNGGKLFTAGFLPDAPLIVATAGNRGGVRMWNLKKEDAIVNFFQQN